MAGAVAGARHADRPLLLAVLALCALGTVLVWAATLPGDGSDPGKSTEHLVRHLAHLSVALAAGLALASVDHRTVRAYAPVAYLFTLAGLVLVLTPLGAVVNGSRGWIVVAGFQYQPSELMKVGLVMALAALLAEPCERGERPGGRDVLLCLLVTAVPLALVALQPDLGTSLVLGAVFFGTLLLSGASLLWTAGMLACAGLAAAAVWLFDLLEPYQLQRLATLADPAADPQGSGYNSAQALIAVGSGGFGGTGLFRGEQTHGRFVPEQHTDFIFTVAGEELGFPGAAALIALTATVLWRILRIARTCGSAYPRLVCAGAAAWLGFQSFVNIGMCLGLMPVTGIPLPFVSYGGTAILANMALLGLVLGIGMRERGFE